MTNSTDKQPEPLQHLEKAIKAFSDSRQNYQELKKILDSLICLDSGQVCFSSFGDSNTDHFVNSINCLESESLPSNRLNSSNLVLITNGAEATRYTYAFESEINVSGQAVLFNIVTHLRCEVFDNFYVSFQGRSNETIERFNLGNQKVRLTNSNKYFAVNNRIPLLYTFRIFDGYIVLYINGIQKCAVQVSEECVLSGISFGLLGKLGSTSEASVLGLHIAASNVTRDKEEFKADDSLERHCLDLLSSGDLKEAVAHIYLNEIEVTPAIEQDLIDCFSRELANNKSFNDWMITYLEKFVSSEFMEQYRQLVSDRWKSMMVQVDSLNVDLFKNPHEVMYITNLIKGRKKTATFNLYNGLSIELFKGDRLGVIGGNGAGKTTFLRTLAGLIPISSGNIFIRGNYMLLKAGIGMRNELTGRENIYHAGGYLGLWGDELNSICDDIIEFSELGESIDRPYKYYSDGMKSRLVFSLATSVRPNVLMLDELLSAGDIRFKVKAEQRLNEFMDKIDVIIIVSHGIEFVAKNCNKALYISQDHGCFFGDPDRAISLYLEELRKKDGFIFDRQTDSTFIDN